MTNKQNANSQLHLDLEDPMRRFAGDTCPPAVEHRQRDRVIVLRNTFFD